MGLERLATYDPNAYERFDNNLADMLVDALNGDTKVLDMPEIQALGVRNIRAALEWLATSNIDKDYKNLITNEGWRLIYVRKPPTPEEYLTPEWIGVQAEGLWPNVRKAFCEFMNLDPLSPKRGLALSTSIGWGKDQKISSNIAVGKTIKLDLEDNTHLEIPSNDKIQIIVNGKTKKVLANTLLEMDLDGIDLPQPMIKKYTK